MKLPFVLLLLAWASAGPGFAGSGAIVYESPHTELTYRYELQPGEGEKEIWKYLIPHEGHELEIEITGNETEYSVSGRLDSSARKSKLSYTRPPESDHGKFELSLPGKRPAGFVTKRDSVGLQQVSGTTPDCETLVSSDLAIAQREVIERVQQDFAAYTEAPLHLARLASGLYTATVVPLLAGDCEPPRQTDAGACYYNHLDYEPCLQCCQSNAMIFGGICSASFRVSCSGPWCRFGEIVCGGLTHVSYGLCSGHNCRGKNGDYTCDEDQPCQFTCMNFCGPGRSSACGHCNGYGPYRTECCD